MLLFPLHKSIFSSGSQFQLWVSPVIELLMSFWDFPENLLRFPRKPYRRGPMMHQWSEQTRTKEVKFVMWNRRGWKFKNSCEQEEKCLSCWIFKESCLWPIPLWGFAEVKSICCVAVHFFSSTQWALHLLPPPPSSLVWSAPFSKIPLVGVSLWSY